MDQPLFNQYRMQAYARISAAITMIPSTWDRERSVISSPPAAGSYLSASGSESGSQSVPVFEILTGPRLWRSRHSRSMPIAISTPIPIPTPRGVLIRPAEQGQGHAWSIIVVLTAPSSTLSVFQHPGSRSPGFPPTSDPRVPCRRPRPGIIRSRGPIPVPET